ncbi:D-2-hydroxyacid dehydrogenase [Lactobacillus sp. W8089]|uniref:D-2-hydroxyacid dehydrogenase n=1 Tax=Bombilactobacillus mellis TaxID=1218508 RepID=UPI001580D488|nr:D-2-hydroxyacid dehydrogenase [Bombilactobacillus mellis]MBI0106910.1 D-2-hydroxyacid dehydrogenase [Lactobacillus sp. W8086]MBI0108374.1 D-2-hydroxyacid dehydrogenase [Lactobacillus sp. W8085]MBI0111592.1 D-2-hydroxyacid dehydrogenase [Lactobacillus sp. W8088]MBI0115307.1 D-2-hydroxyacid dehydrogenase [Lactobacillus sp. W8087]MBI0119032.1 D-2-hydroxyacid dehydrogenase [Lactobacillus sp. W8089]MBI0130997.1 D-2-hydroxyacid dehydrogenase [Lactobacillus sp. W8090]
MKIILLSVRDDELPAIKQWQEKHPDIELQTADWELHPDTVDRLQGFDGVIIQQRSQIGDEVYPELKRLGFKQLTSRTAGFDVINMPLATANNLKVSNVPAYSPHSVAELALTHTMRLIRQLPLFDARMQEQDFRWQGLQAAEISSLTIGIIGAGRIGSTTARIFHSLGAKIIANDTKPNHELDDILTFKTKEEVLQEADVVCLHVDLNETSKNLIDAQALSLMKPSAYIVNECRGPVVDTDALIQALEKKQIAGAALDTLTGEENFFNVDLRGKEIPSEQLKKLRSMDNVIITPHIGFYTNIAVQNMVDISLDDAVSLIQGQSCDHVLN